MERSGQTWLPMGRPSGPNGLARSSAALATKNPAALEQTAAFWMNSRLDIAAIYISPFYNSQPGRYSRLSKRFASGMLVIFALAESQRSLRPPSRSEIDARFTASEIG